MIRGLARKRYFPDLACGTVLLLLLPFGWGADGIDFRDFGFLCFAAYFFATAALLGLPVGFALRRRRLVGALRAACLLAFVAGGVLLFWHYWAEDEPLIAGPWAAFFGAWLSHWNPMISGRRSPRMAGLGVRRGPTSPCPGSDDEGVRP